MDKFPSRALDELKLFRVVGSWLDAHPKDSKALKDRLYSLIRLPAIPLQDLLLAHRRRTAADATSLTERLAWRTWAAAWSKPRRYRTSLRAGRLGETLGFDHRGPAAGWSRTRETPAVAKRSFRQLWEAGEV